MKRTKRTTLILTVLMMIMTFFSTPATVSAASNPAKASISSCKAEGYDTVKVRWKEVKDISGYQLTTSDGETYELKSGTLSKKVSGLESATTYTFKVRAYKTYKTKKWYNTRTKRQLFCCKVSHDRLTGNQR